MAFTMNYKGLQDKYGCQKQLPKKKVKDRTSSDKVYSASQWLDYETWKKLHKKDITTSPRKKRKK